MRHPLRVLPLTLVLAVAVPAQGEKGTGAGEGGGSEGPPGSMKIPADRLPKPSYVLRKRGVVEITFNSDGTQTERVVPPREVKALRAKNRIQKIHAEKLFVATVSTRPRKLAPGESGTLHVLVTLGDDAVVLPGTTWSLDVFRDKLPITLGASQLAPAKDGTLPTRFKGQPVYDNIVELRTPITMRGDAAAGRYPIPGHVELEVHSAKTGDLVGVFYCGLEGWLTVGKSLVVATGPADVVARTGAPGSRGTERAGPADEPKGQVGKAAAEAPGTGNYESGPTAIDGVGPDAPAQTVSVMSSGILILGGGALALLVVVLLLAGRSRD